MKLIIKVICIFALLFTAVSCKEFSEIEQLKDDLIEANITIVDLKHELALLKLNRLDVLAADQNTDECEVELSISKEDNYKLNIKNLSLQFEIELYREAMKEFIDW